MALSCKLKVVAGAHDRDLCPVSIELPWPYEKCGSVELRLAGRRGVVPCQVERKGKRAVVSWLVSGLKAGDEQSLVATALPRENGDRTQAGVELADDKDRGVVDVSVGGKLVTSYHYNEKWARPFFYPLTGPYGTRVTRGWPIEKGIVGESKDHKHHKSVWVAYGECGMVDNWSEEGNHGTQRHRGFARLVSGPVFGRITARNDWCTAGGQKQFEELRDMRFYAVPRGNVLLDMAITFRMTQRRVVFHDTKEGGLVSVRVATPMDVRNGGRIENGYGGIDEPETWGRKAPWCDYSGRVDGKDVGIAVMDHESNPRYPTEWHVRDYGLMTANCFAWRHYRPDAGKKGDMVFKKGQETTWRYRLFVHRGNAARGKVKDRFIDFIAPPEIVVS